MAREAQAYGVKALSILADVGKKDQIDSMISKAMSEFGKIDILINNAAIRPHKPFTELTVEDWEGFVPWCWMGALRQYGRDQ